jgi:hypothetical protein
MMLENFIILAVFILAIAYVARIFYKSFKGDVGCSKGCGCDSPIHQMKKDSSKF